MSITITINGTNADEILDSLRVLAGATAAKAPARQYDASLAPGDAAVLRRTAEERASVIADPQKSAPAVANAETPAEPARAAEKTETKTEVKASAVTKETLRAKLAALMQDGKQSYVKAIFEDFSVAKLSEVPEDKYGELMSAIEKIS